MKTTGRDFGSAILFSLTLCSTSIVASAANSGESAYVYEGAESATKLIHDAERSSNPSLTVALDLGYDDSDRHARDGKLNLIRIDGIPALAYSLNYYGGLGYLPALVITCREKGLLEFSQVLWSSDEIDHKQYEPYVVEYQGYGLDDLFKLPSELESVVDFRGTAIRFRGTIKTDHPGIRRLGPTTNLQAYIRFASMSFGVDNSHHASTLGSLIDHCGGTAVDSPGRPIRANQPPTIPDRGARIASGHLPDNNANAPESAAPSDLMAGIANDATMPVASAFRAYENSRNALRDQQRAIRIAEIETDLSELAEREGRVYRGLWFWSQFRDPGSMRAVFRGNRSVPFTAESGAIYFHNAYPLERGHSDQMGILTAWVRVYSSKCAHRLPENADEFRVQTFTTSGPLINRTTRLTDTDVLRFQHGLMGPYLASREEFERRQREANQKNLWARASEIILGGLGTLSDLAHSQNGPYVYAQDDFIRFFDAVGCDSPSARQMSEGIFLVAQDQSLPSETTEAAIPGAERVSDTPQQAGEYRLHSEVCWNYEVTSHNPCGCLLDIARERMGKIGVISASVDYLVVHNAFMTAPEASQRICRDPLGAISAGLLSNER